MHTLSAETSDSQTYYQTLKFSRPRSQKAQRIDHQMHDKIGENPNIYWSALPWKPAPILGGWGEKGSLYFNSGRGCPACPIDNHLVFNSKQAPISVGGRKTPGLVMKCHCRGNLGPGSSSPCHTTTSNEGCLLGLDTLHGRCAPATNPGQCLARTWCHGLQAATLPWCVHKEWKAYKNNIICPVHRSKMIIFRKSN